LRGGRDTLLHLIRFVHTAIWAIFAGSIVAIPVLAHRGSLEIAWGLIGLVFVEVAVLVANGMRCPLTDVAGRHTPDRSDNFDIYLPSWLARNNKLIFGTLYVAGIAYTLMC